MRTNTLVPEPVFDAPADPAVPEPSIVETGEYELVLGKRQAASLAFLALVVVAMCSGGSYLIGRSAAPAKALPQAQAVVPDPPAISLSATGVLSAPEAPLFAAPLKGPVYIQLAAVEKGVATLLTHGARKLGYGAFITAGTSVNNFRVLVGPFKTATEYDSALAAFHAIGLDNFSRRYQEN